MGVLHIKTMFTSSKEKFDCHFSLLCVIMSVFCFSDVDEKCFEVGLFIYAVIQIQNGR